MRKRTTLPLLIALAAVAMAAAPARATERIVTIAGGPGEGPATDVHVTAPRGVAVAGSIMYVSDPQWNVVRRVDLTTGMATVAVGIGEPVGGCIPGIFGGDGGPATLARLSFPWGLDLDDAGNLLIADRCNNRIRQVDATTGIITTVAGNGTAGSAGDGGPPTAAQLSDPTDVASLGPGNFVIADSQNEHLRYVEGAIITLLGSLVTLSEFQRPFGLGHDALGGVFVTELFAPRVSRLHSPVIVSTPTITVVNGERVAGTGVGGFSGDSGAATAAQLNGPSDVASDSSGNFYIADGTNYRVRRVDRTTGVISTVAGNGVRAFGPGGPAPATSSPLLDVHAVATGVPGEVFVAETFRVRRVSGGMITTVAGKATEVTSGDGRSATSAQFADPAAVAVDGAGNVFIADRSASRVRRVDAASGVITTFAGGEADGFDGDGSPATAAKLQEPRGVAVDGSGNVYVADTGNDRIRRIDGGTGIITTFAGGGADVAANGVPATAARLDRPEGVAVDAAGNVFIADTLNSVIRRVDRLTSLITTVAGNGIPAYGGDGGPALSAQLQFPSAVAIDATGRLYIADVENNRIRRVAGGTITTIAGNGTGGFTDDVPAVSAQLDSPRGVAVDADGNVYIADEHNERIRRVDAVTGMISTAAGGGTALPGDGGLPTAAELRSPEGVAVDNRGNIVIADTVWKLIRRVERSCGNGSLQPGELCDDGNPTNGDGCDNNCTPTACGNGIATAGEACDDGNTSPNDACKNDCTPNTCGDGVVRTGVEQCDDGTANGSAGCCSVGCLVVDPNRVCRVIDAAGGSLTKGNVTLEVPMGALGAPTTLSITEVASGASGFGVGTTGTNLVSLVELGPAGQTFPPSNPARLVFTWQDATPACQARVSGETFNEDQMYVWHNGAQVPGTNKCSARISKPTVCSVACSMNCGDCADGYCCDMDDNTWTVRVTSFSEFALGACHPLATSIVLRNLGTPAGDDRLTLKGEAMLPVPLTPALDLVTTGLRLHVEDAAGSVLDVTLPGGTYANGRGWRVNHAGTRWLYSDRTAAPAGGIYRAIVRAVGPGTVRVHVRGKGGAYAVAPDNLPLAATVALVPPFAQCAEARFAGPAPAPSCAFRSGGAILSCK